MTTSLNTDTLRVLEVLNLKELPQTPEYGPNDAVSVEYTTPYPPIIEDLTRLYRLARDRRATTVLELGSGYSTAILAAAIEENRRDFADTPEFRALRRNNPFEVHTVDVSAKWLEITLNRIPLRYRERVHVHQSDVHIGIFCDRVCHFYDRLPNICPDFIYLDGPSSQDVHGEIGGIHFRHNDRTVISADIARMEWLLLPGTIIVVDGRTNNARFLKKHFQREWSYEHLVDADVHIFELAEQPLGALNRKQIEFCLGKARSGR